MRRSPLLLILIVLLLASRATAAVIFISQDDSGHEFTLDRGDVLEVSLPATSGTGYTWQAEPVAGGIVKLMGEPEFKGDSAMPGVSGHQIFRFAAGSPGSGTLEMRYVRPWEKDKPAAKVFKLKLTLR